MNELIDIYDANLNHIGSETTDLVHQQGLWHITFHLWLVSKNDDGKILYQLRSKDVDNFPDILDVSAAGHLQAGETIPDGVRESVEELGVSIEPSKLHHLGFRVEVSDQDDHQKNREYQAVHMALTELSLDDFKPDTKEVSGLYWIPVKQGIDLFSGKIGSLDCEGIYFDETSKAWIKQKCKLSRKHFLPRIQKYYLTAHIMAERLLNGDTTLAIS
jgi:isopentenyldiphosphate isomerase